jgi:hypothetical protein
MDKLSDLFQQKYKNQQFVNENVRNGISNTVKLHEEIENVRSSAAACLNVLGYLNQHPEDMTIFFNALGLKIDRIIPFPKNFNYDGEIYSDDGPIIFEWIGPKKSPINENGGSRGQNRTSIDAYLIAEIEGVLTQLFIEWKFTETYNSESYLHKFGGKKGIERLRRYSSVLAKIRKKGFPFRYEEEDTMGLFDFSYEPLYQLLRMTLLAKMTTPVKLGEIEIKNYKIVHLTHSDNTDLNFITPNHIKYSPGLTNFQRKTLHDTWLSILDREEKENHCMGYWNKALAALSDNVEKSYLMERYY